MTRVETIVALAVALACASPLSAKEYRSRESGAGVPTRAPLPFYGAYNRAPVRGLEGPTRRNRLAALSSLFEYLCEKNTVS
jgi:hypothetical protein